MAKRDQTPAPAPTPAPLSSDVTAPAAKKVKAVAKHELLDSASAICEKEEDAHGMRYTLLANGETFDYVCGANADADRMLAVFGAKTLATNETSQARNSAKGAASADEQIQAVRDRFATLATGVWVDRSREGGAKVDKDALAEAICQVQVGAGAKTKAGDLITDDFVAAGYKALVRQKLEDDQAFLRTARNMPAVTAAYAALVGRSVATVDDLAL